MERYYSTIKTITDIHDPRTLWPCLRRQARGAACVTRHLRVRGAAPRRALADLRPRGTRASARRTRTHGSESARLRVLPILAQPRRRDRVERGPRRHLLRDATRRTDSGNRRTPRPEPLDPRSANAPTRPSALAWFGDACGPRSVAVDSAHDRPGARGLRLRPRRLPSHDARARPHWPLGALGDGLRAPSDLDQRLHLGAAAERTCGRVRRAR